MPNDTTQHPPAQTQQPSVPAKPKPPLVATGASITAIIPKDIDQAHRLATVICAAQMAPASYKNDVNKVMVAILHGMEVGFTPMAALQSIAVINGMPTIWGDGALGLIEASGLLEDKDEWVDFDEQQRPIAAHCRLKRRGRPTEIKQTFTIMDADEAGLTKKVGPWQQYKRRMLQMRARAWALRDGFSDILRGLGIAEEIQDMGPLEEQADGTYAPPPRPKPGDYQAPAIEAQQDEPEPQQETEQAEAPYELYNQHGEPETKPATGEVLQFPNETWCEEYIALLEAMETRETLEAVMQNNNHTVIYLRENNLLIEGFDEQVNAAYYAVGGGRRSPGAKPTSPPVGEGEQGDMKGI